MNAQIPTTDTEASALHKSITAYREPVRNISMHLEDDLFIKGVLAGMAAAIFGVLVVLVLMILL